MIKAILIDDEIDGLEDLQGSIEKYCPDVYICGTYQTPADGVAAVRNIKPNLVFLDIQMPRMSGFEILEQLSPVDFQVIFVSAYDKYAIKAIRFSALDYLLKPIDIDDLIKAVERVKERLKPVPYSVQSVLQNSRNPLGRLDRIAVPSTEGIDFFDINDIIFLKADDCYTQMHLVNQSVKLISKVLKDFEELLSDSGFCRVHNSYLINLKHVRRYIRGEGGYVILTGNHHIDVSRRRKEEFLTRVKLP